MRLDANTQNLSWYVSTTALLRVSVYREA